MYMRNLVFEIITKQTWDTFESPCRFNIWLDELAHDLVKIHLNATDVTGGKCFDALAFLAVAAKVFSRGEGKPICEGPESAKRPLGAKGPLFF